MSGESEIDNLINDLQSRLAFQDDSLSSLNEMVVELQRELSDLRQVVMDLKQSFAEHRRSLNTGHTEYANSRPPHY